MTSTYLQTENKDVYHHQHVYYKYAACSRGFTIAWILMTICFMIINIIVFFEPEWIGDTPSSRTGSSGSYYPGSPGVGHVGLYQLCEYVSFGHQRICDGAFQDFSTILTDAFRASTFFIGVSCLVMFLCVLFFLLFLCVHEVYMYVLCGSLQVISTVFMFLGCVIFPAGWDHIYVRRICGNGVGRHQIGQCEMRWAYILAIIGIFDILILAIMAFVLAIYHRSTWKDVDQAKFKPVDEDRHGKVVQVAPQSVVGASTSSQYRAAPSTLQPGVSYIDYDRSNGRRRIESVGEPMRAASTVDGGARSEGPGRSRVGGNRRDESTYRTQSGGSRARHDSM